MNRKKIQGAFVCLFHYLISINEHLVLLCFVALNGLRYEIY